MKIAILGAGAIGSTFAFRLARAGHEVTVVARGDRLTQLERDGAIETTGGERAPVGVEGAFDPAVPWDLVIVPVRAGQVDPLLPALGASAARTVMFMFNTFEPLARLRDAVGPERFAFGFPGIVATLDGGRLSHRIAGGMTTPVTDARWAELFAGAGIPAVVQPDMESWLRTHAALIVPVLLAAGTAHARGAGVTWPSALALARAMKEAMALVRSLGHDVVPAGARRVSRLPARAVASLLWAATRIPAVRRSGAAGHREGRALIDQMQAAAPRDLPALRAVRPSPR